MGSTPIRPASAPGPGDRHRNPHLGLLAESAVSVHGLGKRTELLPRRTGRSHRPCDLLAAASRRESSLDREQGPVVELGCPRRRLGGKGLRLRAQQFVDRSATLIPSAACLLLTLGGWPLLERGWPAVSFLVFMLPLPSQSTEWSHCHFSGLPPSEASS